MDFAATSESLAAGGKARQCSMRRYNPSFQLLDPLHRSAMTDPAVLRRWRDKLADFVDPATGLEPAPEVLAAAEDGGAAALELLFPYPIGGREASLSQALITHLGDAAPEGNDIVINLDWRARPRRPQKDLTPLPEIRNIVAVASGKGGVGKSTVSVNLALALAGLGARCGLLDADIHGPSIPRMLGIAARPETREAADGTPRIVPLSAHGIQAMSIGVLLAADSAAIWRGPMVSQALQQLLGQTAWDDLDYLIVDLPPGTGDIQLTLAQKVPLAGALIVTTPQEVAVQDARRALKMFERVEVPVLGVVENMSHYVCPHCGHPEAIFASGGGARLAAECGVPLLATLPLHGAIQSATDEGRPPASEDRSRPEAAPFYELAIAVAAHLAARPAARTLAGPVLAIKD